MVVIVISLTGSLDGNGPSDGEYNQMEAIAAHGV